MSASEKKAAAKSKPTSKPISTADSKSEPKSAPQPADAKSDTAEPSAHEPSGYTIGEGQKSVTKKYRQGWDAIFGKNR